MRYLVRVLFLSAVVAAPAALADCLTNCDAQLAACMQPGGPGENTCLARFGSCVQTCYNGSGGGLPSPYVIDFGNVTIGTAAPWVGRYSFSNPAYRRSTLYLSWTPPLAGDIGRYSGPVLGPFQFGFGQRFELKWREGQNVLVNFVPHEVGLAVATAYIWWDQRGAFQWNHPGVIIFRGTGVAPPPPPPPPPPPVPTGDCITDCANLYDYCRLALHRGESVCLTEHTTCADKCYTGFGGAMPLPVFVDFGKVLVGATAPWPNRYTYKGIFSTATLYVSWTPPVEGNLGRVSPPRMGPYQHAYGQRWELKSNEGQNTLVNFTPSDTGKVATAIMYAWWDHNGSFSWASPGVVVFSGTGSPTRVRCCDGTYSPTCTYVKAGCCSTHNGVCY